MVSGLLNSGRLKGQEMEIRHLYARTVVAQDPEPRFLGADSATSIGPDQDPQAGGVAGELAPAKRWLGAGHTAVPLAHRDDGENREEAYNAGPDLGDPTPPRLLERRRG